MSKKINAVSLILNLILASFAFCFIISMADNVSGQGITNEAGESIVEGDISDSLNIILNKAPPKVETPASGSNLVTVAAKTGAIGGPQNMIITGAAKGFSVTTSTGTVVDASQLTNVVKLTDGTATATLNGKAVQIGADGVKALEAGGAMRGPAAAPTFFGMNPGYFWGHAIQGLMWAGIAVTAIQLVGSMMGLEKSQTNAASFAAGAGILVGKGVWGAMQAGWFSKGAAAGQTFLATPGTGGFLGISSAGIIPIALGLATALVVLELMWKSESKKIITFECQPWEAPTGGANCEKCNDNFYPCTEYRCKSLGQACELLNAGTGAEKCTWVNPKDVIAPIMKASKNDLTSGYEYTPNNAVRPPNTGVKIIPKGNKNGCIKAFTPLTFGIETNEPAQCKIDYNRTMNMSDMTYYVGGSNIFKYNHTETLSLPSPDAINAENPTIKNDGNYNLYVRCKDANGNENPDLFVFSFCVEKGPDVSPPIIQSTSIANNMPIQYGLNKTDIEIYVNEPSECKWSRIDYSGNGGYDNMENTMACSTKIYEMNNQMLYKCKTTLNGLQDRKDNTFYFKCKDQPALGTSKDRNEMTESYKFTLKGSQPLLITETSPNGTIKTGTSLATVYLKVKTENGYNFGDAACSYSPTQNEKDYVLFKETGTSSHLQRLDLAGGDYTYYIQCVDLGGNAFTKSISFKVQVDTNPPIVTRTYLENGKLKILTDKTSICSYQTNIEKACNFQIEEGTAMPYVNSTEHFAEWQTNKNYYIKCMDENGRRPENSCSIIVKPRN